MKKTILLLGFVFAAFISSFAKDVDTAFAKNIAKNFYYEMASAKKTIDYNNLQLSLADTRSEDGQAIYYVYNFSNNGGWVIVSAESNVVPILAYSLNGNYTNSNPPPAYVEWMNNYKDQILYVKQNNISASSSIINNWNNYTTVSTSKKNIKSAGPLVTTTWDQSPYYNNLCPSSTVTGCVATAMGQIMRYWGYDMGYNFPAQGIGSHTDANNTSLTVDYCSEYYDWANMPAYLDGSSTSTQINAVATLLRDCGVSVDMTYGSSSSANTGDVPNALITYYGYSSTAQYIQKSSYSSSGWDNILIGELDAGRPMQYRGDCGGSNCGHSFVCDGYDYDGSSYYYHFNWGWSGSSNGNYYLSSLTPSGSDYTNSQAAVIGIQPGNYISMYGAFSLAPDPIIQGQPLSVSVDLVNYGFEDFNGDIDLSLYDYNTGAWVETIQQMSTVSLTAGYYNTYNFYSSNISSAPGNYYLAASYLNNSYCWIFAPAMQYANPLVVQVSSSVGIENSSMTNAISIYPNPANDNITVENTLFNNKDEIISIYNIQGQMLLQQPLLQSMTNIDISSFANGIYYVKVKTEKEVIVKKFTKE